MRANRAVAVVAVVALLGGWAISGGLAPTAAQAPAPPAAPYRVGYVSADTTGLFQATGEGAVAALPPGIGSVDSDASAGTGGVVWVSHRAASPGGAERDGEIFYLADGSPNPVQLTNDETVDIHPALSPDGRTVAFASERTGSRDLFVIGVDGRGLRQVTSGPAVDDSPSWSPDGTRLAFSSTRDDPAGDIYTVPAGGGVPTRLTADPSADTQPAWGPARIAFTTTRFHPAGDVVLMAATGGAVTRAVPDPGDSAEPAWSRDGTRLAFTTHVADPLGDVKQIAAGQVSIISALPGIGETEPTFRTTGQPVFTELRPGGTTDIWSSDATGGDRHDITNRPGASEEDPAFSSDGTLLAYTEFAPGASSDRRIVVAGSDGSAPRPLTGASAGKREQHPAWSPDATKIAFTDTVFEGESSRDVVRIARVADGRILGVIPIPAYLRGDDSQPAWSADGMKITLTRAANRVAPPGPSRVDPSVVDIPVGQGTSTTIRKTVQTDQIRSNPDIVLLMDQTGSMTNAINDVKANLGGVIDQVRTDPNVREVRFAVAAYGDLTDDKPPPADPRSFFIQQPLIAVGADATDPGRQRLAEAFGRIQADGGGDTAEDWLIALQKLATSPTIGFRPDSSRIVVLVGDAASHEGPIEGRDGEAGFPTREQIIEVLKANNISVVAVPVATGESPTTDPTTPPTIIPAAPGEAAVRNDGILDGRGQATDITRETNGVLTTSTTPGEVAAAIGKGIRDLPVKVAPVPTCDPGLTLTFDPSGTQQVPGGTTASFLETAAVSPTAPFGAFLHCSVEFRLNGEAFARPGYTEEVTVRVKDPRLPLITVHDKTVTGTAPTVIEYVATAVDSDRETAITPICTPLSGSLFSVGATTVTCTAIGTNGTAVETAVMAVDPGGGFRQELWQVALTQPTPDVIVTGDQRDLSLLIGAPCGAGREAAADVSPDGVSIAFETGNQLICAAGADGTAGRIVAQNRSFVDNPAWSPDGALIAFDTQPSEGTTEIAVVPAAGGTPATLISTPGDAFEPAFQRIPDLAVTASAVPAAIAFNGLTTFEFVVTNHGAAASPSVGLFVTFTAGLQRQQVITTKGTCTPDVVCSFGTLAPGDEARVRVVATGTQSGPQAATGTLTTAGQDADARDNHATAAVTVAAKPAPPVTPGSLSIGMSVSTVPLFVGGDDVVLTYLVHNGSGAPMPAVRLVTSLPAALPATAVSPGCAANGSGCALGTLIPGQTVELRISLAAKSAVDAPVSGVVSTSGPDTTAADNTANSRVVIRQPVLKVDPEIGRPGFVPQVTGTDFPPGATVRLAWSVGISASPGLVTVGADGRFAAPFLIFHHDLVGPRTVSATSVSGPKFGTVQSNSLLVVLRSEQPPLLGRG